MFSAVPLVSIVSFAAAIPCLTVQVWQTSPAPDLGLGTNQLVVGQIRIMYCDVELVSNEDDYS